jgi:uncharacterized protein (TIGR02145 family)
MLLRVYSCIFLLTNRLINIRIKTTIFNCITLKQKTNLMKKLFILFAIFTTFATTAQSVGINADGSAANVSAMLDISSTTKGFLPPRMTYAEKTAISTPAAGLIVYCTNCGVTGEMQFYNGIAWINFSGAAGTTVPGAPTILNATVGNAQGTVDFAAPSSNGGSGITGYTVTSSPGSFTATGASSPLTVTGLTNGTFYTFTVIATNVVGSSVASSPVAASAGVTIGTQVWVEFNLDVVTYSDGTVIPQVSDPTAWANLTTGAWCYYNNTTANGTTYGKLYNWNAVKGIHDTDPNTPNKKLAPTGYHIPSDAEWSTLITYLGGDSVAGGKMKATGTALWLSPNQGATNSSGFTGLPGGYRYYNGTFLSIGNVGFWWSSSEYDTTNAWSRYLSSNSGIAYRNNINKVDGFSVRCLRD